MFFSVHGVMVLSLFLRVNGQKDAASCAPSGEGPGTAHPAGCPEYGGDRAGGAKYGCPWYARLLMAEWKEKRQEWLVTDPGADMKIRERGVNKMTHFVNHGEMQG
ncbi:hypothetical protein QYK79_004789 [Salmonella enterica]|nr:hypothetical protein [Salmonella enterica]